MTDFLIRPERRDDVEAIERVTREAFASHPHSNRTEQFIVAALRKAGALTLALVAEREGVVVGHVALSPVTISDGSTGWYGLGPLSVTPVLQGRGIGSALVRRGLEQARALGANGCVLVGEPEYYARFGFAHDPGLGLAGVPPQYFLALRLRPCTASGDVRFHDAFGAKS